MNMEKMEAMIKVQIEDLQYEVKNKMEWFLQTLQGQDELEWLKQNFGATYEPFPTFSSFYERVNVTIKPKTGAFIGSYIRRLRQLGYTRTSKMIVGTPCPQWTFASPRQEGVKVIFIADFTENEEDDTCRLVEIGKETKEIPIMKLVCPEGEMDFAEMDNN